MDGHTFQVGSDVFVAQDGPDGRYSAFFEDDGETAYFYAVDLSRPDNTILDAVHIYNVANVVDRDRLASAALLHLRQTILPPSRYRT